MKTTFWQQSAADFTAICAPALGLAGAVCLLPPPQPASFLDKVVLFTTLIAGALLLSQAAYGLVLLLFLSPLARQALLLAADLFLGQYVMASIQPGWEEFLFSLIDPLLFIGAVVQLSLQLAGWADCLSDTS